MQPLTLDLRMQVFKSEYKGYQVKLRQPDGEWFSSQLSEFNLAALETQTPPPQTYGSVLFDWLFTDEVKDAFRNTQRLAGVSFGSKPLDGPPALRFQLELDPDIDLGAPAARRRAVQWDTVNARAAKGLGASVEQQQSSSSGPHRLRWECLFDPIFKEPLSLSTAFSRYARRPSAAGMLVRDHPLMMMMLSSRPKAMQNLGLTPVAPVASAWEGDLQPLAASGLKVVARGGKLTLEELRKVGRGGHHIIHLLAPAVAQGQNGSLVLASAAGTAEVVPCEAVVEALMASGNPEGVARLFFVSTPPGDSMERAQVLANLGPMLVQAGAQHVVAIQGSIAAPDLQTFIGRFYTSLMDSGMVDLAVRDARRAIYRPDAWDWTAPVLYTGSFDVQLFQPLPQSVEGRLTGLAIKKA